MPNAPSAKLERTHGLVVGLHRRSSVRLVRRCVRCPSVRKRIEYPALIKRSRQPDSSKAGDDAGAGGGCSAVAWRAGCMRRPEGHMLHAGPAQGAGAQPGAWCRPGVPMLFPRRHAACVPRDRQATRGSRLAGRRQSAAKTSRRSSGGSGRSTTQLPTRQQLTRRLAQQQQRRRRRLRQPTKRRPRGGGALCGSNGASCVLQVRCGGLDRGGGSEERCPALVLLTRFPSRRTGCCCACAGRSRRLQA